MFDNSERENIRRRERLRDSSSGRRDGGRSSIKFSFRLIFFFRNCSLFSLLLKEMVLPNRP
jgi:hypothetical protein